MTYVVQRRGSRSWYYREAVPSDVEAILTTRTGKKPSDAMKSLRTTDRREADTLSSERKTIEHFANFVGDRTAVAAISRAHIRDFKRALSEVPQRWTARGELAGMQLADAARTWTAMGGETRSVRTVNREVSEVSAFLAWLVRNAYTEENVATGFRTRIDKAKNKYPPYSDTELKILFSSPLFSGCHAKKVHEPGHENIPK